MPGLYRVMLLMGLYLIVVQINRSGGAVMASELTSTHGYRLVFAMVAVVLIITGAVYTRVRDVPARRAADT